MSKYIGDFVSVEEYMRCHITQKPFVSGAALPYLMIEPLEGGSVFKAKFLYRHSSLYSLKPSDWTYLNGNDARTISPIIDFKEKRKPFYITFGASFYRVNDVWTNQDNILEFVLQGVEGSNLN